MFERPASGGAGAHQDRHDQDRHDLDRHDQDRHETVGARFDELCDLPADERAAHLAALRAEQPELARELALLLAADEQGSDAIEGSALEALGLRWPRVRAAGTAELPERIGRYRILGELGRGGMGVVFLAEQDRPRRRVALKVLRPGLLRPDLVSRFAREAEVLGRLSHPGIAHVYDTGTATTDGEERAFLAMELVEGEPLTTWSRRAQPALAARLELLARLAEAVAHAHAEGVVHRDLKPGNVLVDAAGRPKVLDFGVARIVDPDRPAATAVTSAGEIVGTLAYMSPEQIGGAAGARGAVDARSDVYGLGVVAYELLAGERPYDLADLAIHEAARVVVEAEPALLGRRDPRLAGDVETIVAKALEKDPRRRYADAGELAEDLRRHLEDRPIRARPMTRTYRAVKFARRNRALVGGAGAVFAALLLGLAGTTWKAQEAGAAARRADERMARAEEVTRILRDLFLSVDPELEGSDARVLHMIERADRVLAEGGGRSPLVEAAVHEAIGIAWQTLGDARRAEQHIRASVDLREANGAEPWELAASYEALGRMQAGSGDVDPAIARATLEHAHELRLDTHGPDDPATMRLEIDLLELDWNHGERATVIERTRALVERLEATGPEGLSVLSAARRQLAFFLGRSGELAGAEAVLARDLADQIAANGERHLRTVRSRGLLAQVHREMGRFPEAERELRDAIDIARESLDEDHPDLVELDNWLGALYLDMDRPADAIPHLEHSLAIRRSLRDEPGSGVVIALYELSAAWLRSGHPDEAAPLLEEASALCETVPSVPAETHISIIEAQGLLASWAGDSDRALELQREANRLRRASPGTVPPDLAIGLFNEATLLRRAERFDEALPLLVEARGLIGDGADQSVPDRFLVLYELGTVLHRLGRNEEALPYLQQAFEDCVGLYGLESEDTFHATVTLARALRELGRWSEIEELLERTEPAATSDLRRADRALRLAQVRLAQGRPRDALELVLPFLDGADGAEGLPAGLLDLMGQVRDEAEPALAAMDAPND